MTDGTTPKKDDILDQVKKAEKHIKQALLIKRLVDLKCLARDVLEAKEEAVMVLQDIGVKEEDIKRVIDFVNSLPEVQLTEEDKKKLREEVRSQGKETREEVQKKLEKAPGFLGETKAYMTYASTSGSNALSGTTTGSSADWESDLRQAQITMNSGENKVTLTSGDNELDVGMK